MKIQFLALVILFSATLLSLTSFGDEILPLEDQSLPAITDEQIQQLTEAQVIVEQARELAATTEAESAGSLQSGEFNIRLAAPAEYPMLLKQNDSNPNTVQDEQIIRSECFQQIMDNSPEEVLAFVESVSMRFGVCKTLSGDESQLSICNQSIIDQTNASDIGRAIDKELNACVIESLSN